MTATRRPLPSVEEVLQAFEAEKLRPIFGDWCESPNAVKPGCSSRGACAMAAVVLHDPGYLEWIAQRDDDTSLYDSDNLITYAYAVYGQGTAEAFIRGFDDDPAETDVSAMVYDHSKPAFFHGRAVREAVMAKYSIVA